MKKYFMFVAVAAAGMLASCSSDSLTAGSDPQIEPTQEERVPIQLGVASPSVRATTRGTGTVGSTDTDLANNLWYGQRINAFMFKKGTLTLATETDGGAALYDDAVMITPGTTDNKVEGTAYQTPTDIGEAMLDGGEIKYYPPTGNFDFFGYHGDDAVAASSVVKTADSWVVPFTINGTQDLMSTKAVLLVDANKGIDQVTDMGGSTDYYSAKAARKGVQPILQFDHLLSRLAFVIVPGNNNAGGWTPDTYTAGEAITYNAGLTGAVAAGAAAPADYNEKVGSGPTNPSSLTADDANAYNATLDGAVAAGDPKTTGTQDPDKAVYVKSIQVESKTTGTMAVAWTNDPTNKIEWSNDAPIYLPLKERPAYYQNTDKTVTISKAEYDARPYYSKNSDPSVHITPAEWTGKPTDPYYYEIANPTHHITPAYYNGLTEGEKAKYAVGDIQGDYTEVTTTGFIAIPVAEKANYNLTTLTPTYPKMTHTYAPAPAIPEETKVGEALIVAPSATDYNMKVILTQKVPTNWNTPTVLEEKSMTCPLTIKAPEGGFKANTSYKVMLTVYGFERIEVTTMIVPWKFGEKIDVVTE